MDARPTVVAGSAATLADLGITETRLRDWLAEDPARLGLGARTRLSEQPPGATDDPTSLVLTDGSRCLAVVVQTGEIDAEHGFRALDLWARQRASHPDRTHTAVLVAEAVGRNRTVLAALAEHLPLVVVELRCWRGRAEALIVPSVALAGGTTPLPAAEPQRPVADVAPVDVPPGSESGPSTEPASGTEARTTPEAPVADHPKAEARGTPSVVEAPPARSGSPIDTAPADGVIETEAEDLAEGDAGAAGSVPTPAALVSASAGRAATTAAAPNNDPWRLSRRFAETMAAINAEKASLEPIPGGR